MTRYLGQLPPQPDPQTGLPRPPEAPRAWTATVHTPEDRKPRKPPLLPEGLGPTLEWYQETTRTAVMAGALLFVVLVGAFTVVNGVEWMATWWMWIFPGLGICSGFFGTRSAWIAAGSAWLQGGKRGKQCVRTYELTEVKITTGVRPYLHLTDSSGAEFAMQLPSVQRNPELWALVYNGILHSIADGRLRPNRLTRKMLRLPVV